MSPNINPYSAPSHLNASSAHAIRRFWGRSVVAGLLAATTLGTGLLLCWLWSIGAIDLGKLGSVALASLLFATIALLAAARFYSLGWRKYAVGFIIIALFFFILIVLIALHEAGIFTLFLFR
jgi:hypothetical protein